MRVGIFSFSLSFTLLAIGRSPSENKLIFSNADNLSYPLLRGESDGHNDNHPHIFY
jgi:hypothetical protein